MFSIISQDGGVEGVFFRECGVLQLKKKELKISKLSVPVEK